MQINEIFSSIEGEGLRAGCLATFIRTQFCNLKCCYCDTKYSWDAKDDAGCQQYTDMTVGQIIARCNELGNRCVTLTGGEPLIQKEATYLISRLTTEGFDVNIETNGSIPLKQIVTEFPINRRNLLITMDWKSPSSGERDKMCDENLELSSPLSSKDVIKFVVGTKEDLDDMRSIVTQHQGLCNFFVSPIFGQIEPKEIVEYLKEYNLQNVRMQLQLHKFIWPADMRGV